MDSIDSYVSFLLHFDIDEDKFLNWGINNIIYPPMTEIEKEWESLKYRINNNQKVFIRGYGRNGHRTELYTKMYEQIFNNYNVTIDPSNNTAPKKMIEKLTNNKNSKKYINFQRAHIFARTKNIYLFEAPWNICYIPKLFDPFSGHEAKGHLPEKFQQMFLNNAYNKPDSAKLKRPPLYKTA